MKKGEIWADWFYYRSLPRGLFGSVGLSTPINSCSQCLKTVLVEMRQTERSSGACRCDIHWKHYMSLFVENHVRKSPDSKIPNYITSALLEIPDPLKLW